MDDVYLWDSTRTCTRDGLLEPRDSARRIADRVRRRAYLQHHPRISYPATTRTAAARARVHQPLSSGRHIRLLVIGGFDYLLAVIYASFIMVDLDNEANPPHVYTAWSYT